MTEETPIATREISPFCDCQQNIRCPSCHYPHDFQRLNQEGGTQCDGCGRRIQLKIESYNQHGEWRNIAEHEKESYR